MERMREGRNVENTELCKCFHNTLLAHQEQDGSHLNRREIFLKAVLYFLLRDNKEKGEGRYEKVYNLFHFLIRGISVWL